LSIVFQNEGAPNNNPEIYAQNPQFLIRIPSGSLKEGRIEMEIDLSVPDETDSIGFLILRVPKDQNKRLSAEEISEIVGKNDIHCKTENWESRFSSKKKKIR
jgi:hypothetical protein